MGNPADVKSIGLLTMHKVAGISRALAQRCAFPRDAVSQSNQKANCMVFVLADAVEPAVGKHPLFQLAYSAPLPRAQLSLELGRNQLQRQRP